MPDYQYFCHACQKTFSKMMTLAEYEEGEVLCRLSELKGRLHDRGTAVSRSQSSRIPNPATDC